MRRREHDKIVHLYQREVEHLRQSNRDLLDRLMYVTDRTWTPPPQGDFTPEADEDLGYAWAPEQALDAALDEDPVADYATE